MKKIFTQKTISFKLILTGVLITLAMSDLFAQSNYTNTNFAAVGDSVYQTHVSNFAGQNFDTTGNNITWDYTTLVGVSQTADVYKAPNNTGFTAPQFPFIFNSNNANLASTNNQTISVGTLSLSNIYNYYKKTTASLEQRAEASNINVNGQSIAMKTVYDAYDQVYKFPFTMNSEDSSISYYTSSASTYYYHYHWINRHNKVIGYGTLNTPYGLYNDALKMQTDIIQFDTISINGTGVIADTVMMRELKWFSPQEKDAILIVKQTKVGAYYVTNSVSYLDSKQYFQPIALFVNYPLNPTVSDTVIFQNLSANASSYAWNFDDAGSGVANTSALRNPTHSFVNYGIYNVQLIAYNGALSDTIVLPVVVSDTNQVVADFTSTAIDSCSGNKTVVFSNTSTNNTVTYIWTFGDVSGSIQKNPTHAYAQNGTYDVQLIANYPGGVADTTHQTVAIHDVPANAISFSDSCAGAAIDLSTVSTGYSVGNISYAWTLQGASVSSSTVAIPSVTYTNTGLYNVDVVVTDDAACSSHLNANIHIVTCVVGVSEIASNDVTVYPNPSNGIIALSNVKANYILVVDVLGKEVAKYKTTTRNTFDISNLNSGVYFLKVYANDNSVVTKRIVKE